MDGTAGFIGTSEGHVARVDVSDREAGLTTAELLGNAALGVLALVAIWTALRGVGLDVVDWVRAQLVQ